MKKKMLCRMVVISLLSSLSLTVSAHPFNKLASSMPPTNESVLTQAFAQWRGKLISKPSYTIHLAVDENGTTYQGTEVIQFKLNQSLQMMEVLPVDFEKSKISSVVVNGKSYPSSQIAQTYDGHHLNLPAPDLLAGENKVEIKFVQPYATSRGGFYRFVDQEDQSTYIYSDFEPYGAHTMYPCFDQPDLKAVFQLSVDAPASWQVVTNTLETKTSTTQNIKHWDFKPTLPISTYLMLVATGPFASWKSVTDSAAGSIPLRLFARKSLAKYVESAEWLSITASGLAYYQQKFKVPYPFEKYDQIIVPDFGGAMENVAAITFDEPTYVFHSKPTQAQRNERTMDILHEMAHQWFGDLVTLNWWNDLWLNESFASFMSWRAMAVVTADAEQASRFLFSSMKTWGYNEDQLVTHHPIAGNAADTDEAFNAFDGISYGKGASTLKQLMFSVGENAFDAGVTQYLKNFSFSNAKMQDFMDAIAKSTGRDLSVWTQTWLRTSGTNTLQAKWACDPSSRKISQFSLEQGNVTPDSVLRQHRTRLGFYYQDAKSLELQKTVDVDYSGVNTAVPQAIDLPCPDFIFPNEQDYDFAQIVLDSVSAKRLASISDFSKSAMTREMLWYSFWHSVSSAILPAQDYLQSALNALPGESDTAVISQITSHLYSNVSALKYIDPTHRTEFHGKIEQELFNLWKNAQPGSVNAVVLRNAFLNTAFSEQAARDLRQMLQVNQDPAGQTLDQGTRWKLLIALARASDASVLPSIESERKNDSSDSGQSQSYYAYVSVNDLSNKKTWFGYFTDPDSALNSPLKVGEADLVNTAYYFAQLSYEQEAYLSGFADAYFNSVANIGQKVSDPYYRSGFTENLFPMSCDAQIEARVDALISQTEHMDQVVLRSLKVVKQESEWCRSARALSASSF